MTVTPEMHLPHDTQLYLYPVDRSYAIRLKFDKQTDVLDYVFIDLVPFAPDLSCSGSMPIQKFIDFLIEQSDNRIVEDKDGERD